MHEDVFAQFREYAISPEEMYATRGGGQHLNKQIIHALCEKKDYKTPLEEWQHADYRYWAYKIGISINTLKRWLQEGRNPNKNAQDKILDILDYDKWQDMERNIIS